MKFSSNYVPYGSNYGVSGKEVFMYTGKMDDSATGLYYEGARYYDSNTGRFITQDSYQGNRNDPMSLNRYVYARDNPERYVDTNGHMFAIDENSGIDPLTSVLATSSKTTSSTTTCTRSPDICLSSQGDNQYLPYVPRTEDEGLALQLTANKDAPTIGEDQHANTNHCVVSKAGCIPVGGPPPIIDKFWDRFWAFEFVATADVLTFAAAVYSRGYILATPVGFGLVDADLHTTAYILTEGESVNTKDAVAMWVAYFIKGFFLQGG